MNDLENQLNTFLIEIFNNHKLNRLPQQFGENKIFGNPIFGISSGDDPIFQRFKEVVGPKHLTPWEMWNANGLIEEEKNLRVVSVIFPYSNYIRESSKNAKFFPSDQYCIGRNQADRFMDEVIKELIQFFEEKGFQATSGMLSATFNVKTGRKIYSNWSERHIAFAAGLGTFSLHEGLITEVGCNVRITSVVTNAPLKISKRSNDDPYSNCLFYSNGNCGKCIERCPAKAITKEGHDKFKCAGYGRYIRENVIERLNEYIQPKWTRFNGTLRKRQPPVGCAFCQFNVPCMDKNPVKN
jgi:epoxyqueuosine reductase